MINKQITIASRSKITIFRLDFLQYSIEKKIKQNPKMQSEIYIKSY